MKYFILVGEKSGDLHGSNLIKELKIIDSQAEFICWGGDLMLKEGAQILVHHKNLAIMGLLGVLQNLAKLKSLFSLFKSQINSYKPDTIIFIDYGGFNLKAAKIAKMGGFLTQFYIAPKVWAWNKGRIHEIKKWIDQLYVIFPFELEIFNKINISTHYVGNPLQDSIKNFIPNPNFIFHHEKYVALLPGSRKQEILASLPIFENLAIRNPQIKFVIAGVSEWKDLYKNSTIPVILDETYQVIHDSFAAVVTSGTATLETALLNTPLIVVYKTDWLFYSLAKMVVKIQFISLVNIILKKLAVPELIQANFSVEHIESYLYTLWDENSLARMEQIQNFKDLKNRIGLDGASEKTAKLIYDSTLLSLNNS